MASSRDVRAGRAFVELGTNESKLLKGLKRAMTRVRSFADEAAAIGTRVALFGAGTAGGLITAVKLFRDSGAELARLRDQTGLSADALAGLARAAADNGVPFEELRQGLSDLQDKVGRGGAGVELALNRIGTSVEELQRKPLAETIALLADRLPELAHEGDRVATIMELMGGSGVKLLPVLQGGARGLNEAARAAREAGQAFDDEALDAAVELDESFNELTASSLGLRNAIGNALASSVGPYVDGLTAVIQGVNAWIKANPELARTVLNASIAVGALGAAVVVLSAGLWAASSPMVLVAALLVGIGTAALAVTDVLGITETGFGDLWNSIRIGGQGLGTWFAKFWTWLQAGWELLTLGFKTAWDAQVTVAKNAGSSIYYAILWVPRAILKAFRGMVNGLSDLFGFLAGVWNDTIGQIAGEISVGRIGTATVDRWIDEIESKQNELTHDVSGRHRQFVSNLRSRGSATDGRLRDLAGQLEAIEASDRDDGQGSRFDSARAKGALATIGESIGDVIKDTLEGITLPGAPASNASPFGSTPGSIGSGLLQAAGGATGAANASKVDVFGGFNAAVASRIGVGSGLAERQASAAESTARNTRDILDAIRTDGGGVFT